MKTLTLIVLTFITLSISHAKPVSMDTGLDCAVCEQALRGDPSRGEELTHLRNIAGSVEPNYGKLAAGICNSSHRGLNRSKKMKKVVTNFMIRNNLSKNNPPTNREIILMFNKNKNKMKCRGLHFVTYLMSQNLGSVVFDDFINDEIFDETESVFFDFNVVTGIYNPVTKKPEPMTVLDFIEKVAFHTRSIVGSEISRSHYEMIKEILIEDYGAARLKDLPASERNKHNTMLSRK